MARKLNTTSPSAEPDANANPLNDLYKLHPDVELEIGDRKITIGEYRLFDGMTARAKAAPLIADLEALAIDAGDDETGLEAYLDLLAKHRDLTRELVLLAIAEKDRDADFINAAQGPDAELLLATWWATCSRFFWRAVVGRKRDRVMADLRRQAAKAGRTSSTPSPTPDTAAAAISGVSTPSVN